MRIGRLAAELKMRRRGLDVYQGSADWPGKRPASRRELARSDEFLVVAAQMLEIVVPVQGGESLAPEVRATSRIAWRRPASTSGAPRVVREGGCY